MNVSEVTCLTKYTAIIDMGFIWRMANPTTEDREKQDARNTLGVTMLTK